ncbi:MAG: metallophosphoesterase [Chloroflexota bacterium]
MVKIAVIGDVHTHFDDADVAFFNQSDFDLILFVGDLANYRFMEGITVARKMAQLEKTAVFIPGNHDTVTPLQMLATIRKSPFLKKITSFFHPFRINWLRRTMSPVMMGGYQTFSFDIQGLTFDVVTGRPFSWGENMLANPHYLNSQFGIQTTQYSIKRLKECVDGTRSNNLIFLAHTGPHGLSKTRSDIWGIDYKKSEGDNGDIDLEEAITHAKAQGKKVWAVVAGHMHHRLKKEGYRETYRLEDGTHYINAARVPRIFEENNQMHHHFVAVTLANRTLSAEPQAHISPKIE